MLCLVPTPIGNLEDISKRSLRVLEEGNLFLWRYKSNKKKLNLLGEKKQPRLFQTKSSNLSILIMKIKFYKL